MDALYLVGIAVLAVFGFVFAVILFNFFGIWLRARIANAPVSMGKMVGMRLRKVPVGLIVDSRITAVKAGIDVPSDPLEAHYLAGGDVNQVILALIAADKAGIFGLSHAYQHLYGILLTTFLGIFFAVVYLALRRNLWVIIIGHGVYDAAHAIYLSGLFGNRL